MGPSRNHGANKRLSYPCYCSFPASMSYSQDSRDGIHTDNRHAVSDTQTESYWMNKVIFVDKPITLFYLCSYVATRYQTHSTSVNLFAFDSFFLSYTDQTQHVI